MKYLLSFFVLFISINTYAQTGDECKYFQVFTFIKTNMKLNDQINEYINFRSRKKKGKFIEFNVSPWVEFIEIRQFKDSISADSVGISKEIISNDRRYYLTYNFEPFKSVFLEKTAEKNETEFYITFSKVIGRTLLVEILNFDNRPIRIRRIGGGVKILFEFDQQGLIKNAFVRRVNYN